MEPDQLFADRGEGILELRSPRVHETALRTALVPTVGRKGAGLAIIPPAWTPPFFFVSTAVFQRWLDADRKADDLFVQKSAEVAARIAREWEPAWQRGLIVRSSATDETLRERGANTSIELAADFDAAMIARAISQIYAVFSESGASGAMALVVQPRVQNLVLGHISNEQRVSKTVNQWMWEQEPADQGSGRFNSQREQKISTDAALTANASKKARLVGALRRVGRWATLLDAGRTHLEWGATAERLWLYQLDFEDDQPDEGVDPTTFLRDGDFRPPGTLKQGSPFSIAPTDGTSGWSKIDKTASFVGHVTGNFPTLIYLTGDQFIAALADTASLIDDLRQFGHDRVVCRTDCRDKSIPSLNLPRTQTVSADCAIEFMSGVVSAFAEKGVAAGDICFVLHKFIPSVTAAWAVARKGGKLVRVDSLWGLPDGLQYLPHDSFEYDLALGRQSTERLHYKHAFLQETETGRWEVVRIGRKATRGRTLPAPDLAEVARITQAIADDKGADVQVMWFCVVPHETGLVRNIPWFSMPPAEHGPRQPSLSPSLRRLVIRSFEDITAARRSTPGRTLLLLEPDDPELFRSQKFLDDVVSVAMDLDLPVALTGSILAHAFYVLERAGLTVVALAEPTRSRTRQRRVFRKLVRDQIPAKIEQGGEVVTLAEIDKGEARAALVCKLFEEAFELLRADTPQDVTAELADVLEVVKALASTTGVDWAEVIETADLKRAARGGFDRNLVLLETSSPGWPEVETQGVAGTIPLARLGQITRSGEGFNVGYPLLLSSASPITFNVGGALEVTVTLSGDGLQITSEAGHSVAGQFDFGF